MNRILSVLVVLCGLSAANGAGNLVVNGSFEKRDPDKPALPASWTATHHQHQPLEFTGEHFDGATGGVLVGDGRRHMWRQDVIEPDAKSFRLSAYVKAENAVIEQGDSALLYLHIMYKGQPYSQTTHVYTDIPPGTYDWKQIAVSGNSVHHYEIEKLHVTVSGRLSSGRICVDQVELTEDRRLSPAGALEAKIDDLLANLDRVGEVDESVAEARGLLNKARSVIKPSSDDLREARQLWIDGARAVSHKTWVAMFPEAMSDKPVEAQMIYHGMDSTKSAIHSRLNFVESSGFNATYESFGGWARVVYHSDVIPVEPERREFDSLTYFISEAHKRGIKVFGYLAALYGTSDPRGISLPGSIAYEHPEWFASGPDPNMPKFPDPANPEVVDFTVRAYVELATRYDLDGIGLDYIRYPSGTSLNFDENNRRQILERFGIDIKKEGLGIWKDPEMRSKIRQYRAEKVGHIIKLVRDTVKAERPDMTLMACLISELDDARDLYGQNWERSSEWLEYATPMNYGDRSLDEAMLAHQRDVCKKNKAIYIPAIGGMPPVHQKWTISTWAERVALQRKIGCDGIIIYRMNGFDHAVGAFFGNGPFHTKAKFPEPLKP